MFGERYFATRERLSVVVRGIRELASDTGTDASILPKDDGFMGGLHEPFLFLVCGETNAGKSEFINGLFGTELCETEAIPTTKEIQWFRYSRREHDEEQNECVQHCFRDQEFLLDFTAVDTPGINLIKGDCRAHLDEFYRQADIVFFILPASNPWSAVTWNSIADLPEEIRGKLTIVVQQKDVCNEEDISVMMDHVRELSLQKIGQALTVFPVSGQQSLLAKLKDPRSERYWRESGYPPLEDFVSRQVALSPSRRALMRDIRDAALQTLRDIEDRMEIRRRTLDSDQGFLSDVETEVDHEREQQAQRLAEKFSGLGDVFEVQADKAARMLVERTGTWQSLLSLFQKDGTPAEIEKGLIDAVQAAIEQLASTDSDELVEVCRGHWQTVIPRVEERLEMPPPDFDKESGGFAGSKERFAKRLGGAARKAVVAQKIRGLLDAEMEAYRRALRKVVASFLLLVTGAGLLGVLQLNWLAFPVLVAAIVILVVGLLRSRRGSRELVRSFQEKASSCRRPFAEHLSADYQEGVRGFFVEYATMFEGIRRHVADLKMKLKPQLDEWSNLFLELNAIDQDL